MIFSVTIYLITYAISIFSAYIISLSYRENHVNASSLKQKTIFRFFLYFLVIFPPCLLAAFRDYSVGVDLSNFYSKVYPIAIDSNSFGSFNNSINNELLYNYLIYFSIKLTHGMSLLLFTLQLLVIAPILLVGYKMRNIIPLWAVVSVYLFVFYNNSLNLMQQSIASSIVLLSSILWFEKRKISSALFFIIATLIHQSAIVFLPIVIIANFVTKGNNKWRQSFVLIGFLLILLKLFESVITWMVFNTNILPLSYVHYYNIFIAQTTFSNYYVNPLSLYSLIDIIMRVLFVVIPIIVLNTMKQNKKLEAEKIILLISLIIYSFILYNYKTMYGGRITLYGDFFVILFFSRITSIKQYNLIFKLLFWSMILSYWLVFVIRLGWSGSSYYHFRL